MQPACGITLSEQYRLPAHCKLAVQLTEQLQNSWANRAGYSRASSYAVIGGRQERGDDEPQPPRPRRRGPPRARWRTSGGHTAHGRGTCSTGCAATPTPRTATHRRAREPAAPVADEGRPTGAAASGAGTSGAEEPPVATGARAADRGADLGGSDARGAAGRATS